jgi:kynureninase
LRHREHQHSYPHRPDEPTGKATSDYDSSEHSATLKYCAWLQTQGYQVTYLPVNAEGALDLKLLEQSIRADTALVSIMWANNETGILFPVELIAELCRQRGVLLHVDAVQIAGKLPIDLSRLGVNLLSLSSHKLHGPKGVGVLYVRRHTKFRGYLIGGDKSVDDAAGRRTFRRSSDSVKPLGWRSHRRPTIIAAFVHSATSWRRAYWLASRAQRGTGLWNRGSQYNQYCL